MNLKILIVCMDNEYRCNAYRTVKSLKIYKTCNKHDESDGWFSTFTQKMSDELL